MKSASQTRSSVAQRVSRSGPSELLLSDAGPGTSVNRLFLDRIESTKPILASLEDELAKFTPRSRRRRSGLFPEATTHLLCVLHAHLSTGLIIRVTQRQVIDVGLLRRKERLLSKTVNLLEQTSDPDLPALKDMLARTLATVERSRRRKTSLGAKCPTLSHLITDLYTVLSTNRAICASYHTSLSRYALVGSIVGKVTSPSCLCCDGRHRFRDPRAVRARDSQRNRPDKRRELLVIDRAFSSFLLCAADVQDRAAT